MGFQRYAALPPWIPGRASTSALFRSASRPADRTREAVYVPADDLTDPAPATTFAHLDATTVLSRQIAETLGG